MPLDDDFFVLAIRMEAILAKDLALDSPETWFGEEEGKVNLLNDNTAADFFIVHKHHILQVPAGVAILWARIPRDWMNSSDKCEKAMPKGILMVQWVLKNKSTLEPSSLAAREIKHSVGKLLTSHGDKKPWSKICKDLQDWVAMI